MLTLIEKYYNKFNEDKRLTHRHGIVEYEITMKYIQKFLKKYKSPKIIDIGAGTGKYSIFLSNQGYDVTAVELVKCNLQKLQEKNSNVKAYQGNALNLSKFNDKSFDITLLLGPMYHLFNHDDLIKVLNEAKRITKDNGIIFVAYYMNEYAILIHGFRDGNIDDSILNKKVDNTFHCRTKEEDIYNFYRLKDINKLNREVGLKRVKIFAPDGPSDYMRETINKLSDKDFDLFIKYQMQVCENKELLGASSHLVDIIKKNG
jgi:ubiquinone/menaquinone biosynthesis C-methylase UbiE